jgi:hypothetical protein
MEPFFKGETRGCPLFKGEDSLTSLFQRKSLKGILLRRKECNHSCLTKKAIQKKVASRFSLIDRVKFSFCQAEVYTPGFIFGAGMLSRHSRTARAMTSTTASVSFNTARLLKRSTRRPTPFI